MARASATKSRTMVEMSKGVSSEGLARHQATNIEALWRSWTKRHRGRGGWWALAGFSYQFTTYLVRFFRGVLETGTEPGELAQIELAADILQPQSGKYILTQVKRTLTNREQLRSAVREAYDLAAMCDPVLLNDITFQIACLKNTLSIEPHDLTLAEVVGEEGDPAIWFSALERFSTTPIIEEPDPLSTLYNLLYYDAGISNVADFVDGSLGLLLRLFEAPDPRTIADIGRRLASSLEQARLYAPAPHHRVRMMLTREDVTLRSDAAADREIVFRRPLAKDLALGRFRQRPSFVSLVSAFSSWWQSVVHADGFEKVPVFWIDGRWGEGKSVMLLQLAQHLLDSEGDPYGTGGAITFLPPEDLPRWLADQRYVQGSSTAGALPMMALIDDLHRVEDLDRLQREVKGATDIAIPRVIILACGPTPERIEYQNVLADFVAVQSFAIPNLDQAEREQFRDWYVDRTGQTVDLDDWDPANRTLVIWMFELLQRQSLGSFAANFRARLKASGLLEVARAILAANALELPAPDEIVEALDRKQFAAFRQLCDKEQLHFAKTRLKSATGYRLAHPQIDWRLYCEWTPLEELSQSLGSDLARSVEAAIQRRDWRLCHSIVFRLSLTTRLNTAVGKHPHDPTPVDAALIELYRHQAHLQHNTLVHLLPSWLQQRFQRPTLELDPDPIAILLDIVQDAKMAFTVDPSAIQWIWLLSEKPAYDEVRELLRQTVRHLINVIPDQSGVAQAMASLLSRTTELSLLDFAREWLQTANGDEAFPLLAALIRNVRSDADVRDALRRLQTGTYGERGWDLLNTLVRAMPRDLAVLEFAYNALLQQPLNDNADALFRAFLAATPHDDRIASMALDWIGNNSDRAAALLPAFLTARPWDDEIVESAREWLRNYDSHDHAGQVILALLHARPFDVTVVDVALNWFKSHPTAERSPTLLAALIARLPESDEIARPALAWLTANEDDPRAPTFLGALIGSRPRDLTVIIATHRWLDGHPEDFHADFALGPLLKADPRSPIAVEAARRWLTANPNHARASNVLGPLIKSIAHDGNVSVIVEDWLFHNPHHPMLAHVLCALVAANPKSAAIANLASTWLRDRVPSDETVSVLMALISARREDPSIISLARAAIYDDRNSSRVYAILVPLIAAHVEDEGVVTLALSWIASHLDDDRVPEVLAPLVARCSDNKVVEITVRWLERHPNHYLNSKVLAPLAARKTSDAVDQLVCEWVADHFNDDQVAQILPPLVAKLPESSRVLSIALQWVDRNQHLYQSRNVMMTLLANRSDDDRVTAVALRWLAEHPYDRQNALIIARIATTVGPADETIVAARKWLDRYGTEPDAATVLLPLLEMSPVDESITSAALYYTKASDGDPKGIARVLCKLLQSRNANALTAGEARRLAQLQVTDNFSSAETPLLIAVLLRLSPNDAAMAAYATRWIDEHPHYDSSVDLISVLLLGRHGEEAMKRLNRLILVEEHFPPRKRLLTLFASIEIPDKKASALRDDVLLEYLANNWGRPGYTALLRVLRLSKGCWDRLEKRGLPAKVIADYLGS
jgi:hypothetical protein